MKDATAEVMLTTLGKIPKEMYYLEDTAPAVKATTYNLEDSKYQQAVATSTQAVQYDNESGSHSTILFALLAALLIILLLCCTTACLIAKVKRKNNFFGKHDRS